MAVGVVKPISSMFPTTRKIRPGQQTSKVIARLRKQIGGNPDSFVEDLAGKMVQAVGRMDLPSKLKRLSTQRLQELKLLRRTSLLLVCCRFQWTDSYRS